MSRATLLVVTPLVIGVGALIAAWLVVPEFRCLLGFDDPGCQIETVEDDFSDTASGWADSSRNPEEGIRGNYGYRGGGYYIRPAPYTSVPSRLVAFGRHKDTRVEVDAIKSGNAADKPGGWGVFCRNEGGRNYYLMGITSEGTAFIDQITERQRHGLRYKTLEKNIADVSKTNRIRSDCVGSRLSLYINDEYIFATDDPDFSVGYVGLYVEDRSRQDPGVEVVFDNFAATSWSTENQGD